MSQNLVGDVLVLDARNHLYRLTAPATDLDINAYTDAVAHRQKNLRDMLREVDTQPEENAGDAESPGTGDG